MLRRLARSNFLSLFVVLTLSNNFHFITIISVSKRNEELETLSSQNSVRSVDGIWNKAQSKADDGIVWK